MSKETSSNPQKKKAVSLRNVAESIGVSRMTVSRAFKKDASIKPELRARILKAAKEMGYEPDTMVSELMTSFASRRPINYKETFAAIWWPERWAEVSLKQGYHADIYRGLNEGAKQHGRAIDHFVLSKDMPARVINRMLHARNIQGVIITPTVPSDNVAPDLDWDQLSAVIIGSSLREPQFHRAQASHYSAIVNALETFEARGYKRPCLLIHSEVDERTHRAYTAAFQAWGHPMKRVWQANTHESEGLEAWLKKTKPDVIMADWDLWYQAIPEKMKASCSFLSLSVRNREGPITGIHQNTASIAKCSVDLLVRARLQHELGEPQEPVLMLTVGTWIEGTTLKDRTLKLS